MIPGRVGLALAAFASLGFGCTNSLYFYETGKASITLEGRPDSTEPVQGNIGFKQRTALIAPALTDENGMKDAGSMIASFRLSNTNQVLIRTALVTGEAAACLSPDQTQNTARAVAQAPPPPTDKLLAKNAKAHAEANGKTVELRELLTTPFSSLTEVQRSKIAEICGWGAANGDLISASLYEALVTELAG